MCRCGECFGCSAPTPLAAADLSEMKAVVKSLDDRLFQAAMARPSYKLTGSLAEARTAANRLLTALEEVTHA